MENQERIDRFTDVPHSFEEQIGSNRYLGSPAVVGQVIQVFLAEILDWVRERSAGSMTAEQMTKLAHERAAEFAKVFSGEDDHYLPIKGWNTRVGGLQESLKSDLGHYWQSQRAAHDDDPYRVLYAWMLWAVVDALKNEDPDVQNIVMGDRIQKMIRLLTGSIKRAG